MEGDNHGEIQDSNDLEKANDTDDSMSDDGSSDSSVGDEESPEICAIEEELKSNPYYYDGYLKLIGLLREAGNLEKVREARERMSTFFPLTEELWLQWISDESPLAVIPERREYIISLFEKAVKDYISVKIWIEYCQFAMDRIDSSDEIEAVRSLFERAIIAAGLHVTEGSSLWEGYREFELSILESYQQLETLEGSAQNTELQAKIQGQMAKAMSVFKRQLSVPLLGMQQTMRIFEDWSPEPVSESLESTYQKSLKKMEECLPYEEALVRDDSFKNDAGRACFAVRKPSVWRYLLFDNKAVQPKLTEYDAYIAYEMKDGNPARIQCIFERALRDNCLTADLWSQYTNYLDHKLKTASVSIPVHERAVRNCPWVSTLWQNYIRALERMKCEKGRVKATLDQGLQCGFAKADDYVQLWLAYLDYLFRKRDTDKDPQDCEELRKAFESAVKYINTNLKENGDHFGLIPRFWAFAEVKCFGNLQRAQEIWDGIMKTHSRQAQMWLEYTNFLRIHGNLDLTRKVFQRAVQTNMDYPDTVCNAFLRFEREEGNISQFDLAQQRVDENLKRRARKKEQEDAKEAEMHQRQVEQAELRKDDRKKKKQEKIGEKRKQQKSKGFEAAKEEKVTHQQNTNTLAEPPSKRRKEDPQAVIEEEDEEKPRPKEDKNTVFLSNLLFTVDENQIREKFATCGDIAEIRLVKNRSGKSKGFAYLEFKDEQSVNKALTLDRDSLGGRPVFVSPMTDKSKNPTQFKFSTTLDKSTVFVSNLPFTIKEDEIRDHFKECGNLKQVRLVTNRSGKQKGYGYVEFENENAASQAVLKLDSTELGGRTIHVALSNPPSRKIKKEEQPKDLEKPVHGSRGKARTQLAMMPRALSKPKEVGTIPSPEKEANTDGRSPTKKMSNDDFRKLLGSK